MFCIRGGGISSALSPDFEDDAEALSLLHKQLCASTSNPGHDTKEMQMQKLQQRQETGILEFISKRDHDHVCPENTGMESFWAHNIAPAGAGQQSFLQAELLLNGDNPRFMFTALQKRKGQKHPKPPNTRGVFNETNYATYNDEQLAEECKRRGFVSVASRATLMKYLKVQEKAKRTHEKTDTLTWSMDELKIFSRGQK
jgi:hypothetical protein